MMRTRRLRWHGAARRQALVECLRQDLAKWIEEWSVESAPFALRLADESQSVSSDWRWMRASAPSGSIVFGAPASSLDRLGGLLARVAPDDAFGLGQRIGMRALRALIGRFLGGESGTSALADDSVPSGEMLDPRFGNCLLAFEGPGFQAGMLVDNDAFESRVRPQPAILSPVVARDAVLGKEPLTLDVVLDLGDATLADAQPLRVGDVLVSNAPIDSLFHLALPDSRRLVAASLVRSHGRRAIQIVSPSPQKNP
jgi:hypothetical protein